MIARAVDWVLGNRVYFYPVFVPMACYYAIELLHNILVILQVASGIALLAGVGSMCGGIWFAVTDKLAGERLVTKRSARVLTPFVWGYDLVNWLAEDVDCDDDAETET